MNFFENKIYAYVHVTLFLCGSFMECLKLDLEIEYELFKWRQA